MSIIQRIEIRQSGAEAAERAIEGANDALDETAAAGGRASAGLDRAGRAARESGRSVEGAGSWWAGFKRTVSETSEGIGKVSFATQGFGFILGAISGGAIATFIGQLGSVIDAIAGPLGWATSVKILTEEIVKNETGIKDLTSGMNDYARSLGLANEKGLTFLQRTQALQAILGGGSQNRAAAEAKAAQDYAEIAKIRTALVMSPDSDSLKSRLRFYEDDLKLQEKLQTQFAIRSGEAQNGANGVRVNEELLPPPEKPKGVGARRPAPVGGTFFGLDRTASAVYAGAMAGPAFGPADDPFARRLAAFEQKDLGAPFSAATAAIEAFRDAQDRAFDTERAGQFFDIVNASVDQFGQGVTQSAANAILFGTSFSKGVNTAMKALAAQAAAQALWEGAQAVGALAMGRPDAAALHWEAAALYTGVAAIAALGAAASGGLRSGGGRRGGAGAGGGAAEVGPDRSQPTVFAPTIIVGLDGEPIYRGMHRYNDTLEGSRAQRRFAVAA